MANIPVSGLLKTLRDAIIFTRMIGIAYLWIDSPCIIQDSKEDWEIEATDMASVYGLSYCTLAATHSKYCGEGLFWYKEFALPDVLTSKLQPCFPDPMVLFRGPIWNQRVEDERAAPLSYRLWVLQELRLSPRIVHFTYDQVLWKCHHTRRSQYYPTFLPEDDALWKDFKLHNLQKPKPIDEQRRFKTR
jgi:hypothetical protein